MHDVLLEHRNEIERVQAWGDGRDSIALAALRQHIDAHPEVLRPIDAGLDDVLGLAEEGGPPPLHHAP